MDPNATHSQLLTAIGEGDMERAAELMLALDDWLSAGGFLPDQWQQKREPKS